MDTKRKYKKQPRYLREKYLGADLTANTPDGFVANMRFEDVDVSEDKVHWFHLGGDICLHDLTVYKSK